MKKPLILHCINSLGKGGAEILLRDTIFELNGFNHIICYLRSPDIISSELQDYQLYKCNHTSWWSSLNTVKTLRKIIKKHKPQIIHAHLFEATLFARIAVPKSIPFFFTIHNVMSKDAFEVNKLSKIAEKFTYSKNQHLISVSQDALNDYNKWIGIKGKTSVLYNYINQKFFDIDYNYSIDISTDFCLVAIGNLRRQKNYSLLLEAFKLLKDIPVSLDIYGSGDLDKELRQKIIKHGLKVRLMGRSDDVSKILPRYHAYIMASIFEGFGISPMEAMATGMPVILSDLEVFKELAEDIPVYFNPQQAESIADAIRFSFNNWQCIKDKAKKGKEIIYKKASKDIYFKQLLKIYSYAGE